MNLFGTVLTYTAPSANYRGESELNRSVIQKVTDGRFDYPIISPEAMRNALRETLGGYGLPCNRSRLHDAEQLAVVFKDYPDPDGYVDDFFFGYLVAASAADRKRIEKELNDAGRNNGFTFKRDSILRMNLAKALEPYRHNAVFTQSPLAAGDSKYKNATTSALLHRETVVSAFQYPFALNLDDCACKDAKCKHEEPKGGKTTLCKRLWTRRLLQSIGELNDVAGNHARSYFEMAPASLVVRVTKSLVAGYGTYGFRSDKDNPGDYTFPEVIDGILHDPPDYPGDEFFLGGKLVKNMESRAEKDKKDERSTVDKLRERGVTLERDPRRLLEIIADKTLTG
jgi:CRISPR-associated protein Cst2